VAAAAAPALALSRHPPVIQAPPITRQEKTMDTATRTPNLYDRLGQQEGITRITRTLIDKHMANPLVSIRYAGSDMKKVEQRVVEFFCAGAGGPQTYTGKDMLATHKGMNISEQEFVAVVDDAMAALQTSGIDAATCNDVLAILWALKWEVVRV
jgi:hemoglobin